MVSTVKRLCWANPIPRSQVNDRRKVEGRRRTCLLSAVTTLTVSFPGTFTSSVRRDRHSTKLHAIILWNFPKTVNLSGHRTSMVRRGIS